ncbi:MAG: energy-coupling factor ABC transporter ATP-binding protein [Candidatus Hydrogenedentota bacterium]|nr:MAG: energy-coupling factor ABC transporter ATP-binding protein [Candidatus Hydrogenedentota bacterium]
MSALISMDKVTFGYNGAEPVLNGLSLELNAGERLGLTGPNGSGKTTLLRLLMGLERPTAGTITILDKPRVSEADYQDARRAVGYLFQNSDDQLFCPTVFEDVAFGPINQGFSAQESHDRAHATLEALGLADLRRRITYQLSYGQKRLVALATILAMEPKILLLDEPTTGLDEKHETRLTEILLGLPQDMLIVSHNQPFLEAASTRQQQLRS